MSGKQKRILHSQHPFVASWRSMLSRCDDPWHNRYKTYGGRGIEVDIRWYNFDTFYEDMFPSWAPGLQIDRIDINGNYTKSNCQWLSLRENSRKKTTSKLTAEQVAKIREDFAPGLAYQEILAKEYGVSSRMIRYIAAGKSWA